MLTSELTSKGFQVWPVGDRLRVSPKEKITPEISEFIKTHKDEIMAELQNSIYQNPHTESMKEARMESLFQVMDVIYQDTFKKVREAYERSGLKFKGTPEILSVEQRIETLQQAVLEGEAKLKDFRLATHEWKRASMAVLN